MKRSMPPAAIVLAVGMAGCSGDPAEQLSTALERVVSWSATVRTVTGHWLEGRAPMRYTRATLAAALKSLEKERSSLAASPQTAADPRVENALVLIEQVETATTRLWTAVGERDAERVRDQREALSAIEGPLRGLGGRSPSP